MKTKNFSNQRGSLLLEILLAVAIAAIIIGGVSFLIMTSLKSGQLSGEKSAAMGLAEEGLEAVKAIGGSDWHNIYLPPDGTGNPIAGKGEIEANAYYVHKKDNGGSFSWEITKNAADGNIIINGVSYIRKIYIFNVMRNKTGDRQICVSFGDCPDGEIDDPSTQRIKVRVSGAAGEDITAEEYVTRWKNSIFIQTNWLEAPPATEAVCQSAGGIWNAAGAICYARQNYPDTEVSCIAAGGVWNPGNSTCSAAGQNNWRSYGFKENAIDNSVGKLKLKP